MAKRQLSRGVWAFLAVVTAQGVAEAGTVLPSESVECGQAVDHSLRVANNLEDCPGDGLVVAADDITIDLGGHRIDGDDTGIDAGVQNLSHIGVTIRNGTVTGFDFGVNFSSNAQGVVSGIQAFDNRFGIDVSNSQAKSLIKKNVVSRNSGAGLRLFGSTQSVFKGNTVVGNAEGISIENASGATFTKNRVSGNGGQGIDVNGTGITIKGNTISGNGDNGIDLFLSSGNTLSRNVISANGSDGIEFIDAPDNALEGNAVSGNDDDGIRIGTSTGNVLKGNTTNENGVHGISSDTSDVTLVGNRADRNGFIGGGTGDDNGSGIFVPAGTTNANNEAEGNDDPQECEPSDMSCFVP